MGKRVLIINDKTLKRRLIKYTLSKHGYEIIEESRKGSKAVSLYNHYKPDLVAIDINMHQYYEGVMVILLIDSDSRNIILKDAKNQDLKIDVLDLEDTDYVAESLNKVQFPEAI